VGVVSDTHDQLANVARIVEVLNAARVERVVHTGDITQAKTLHALARLDAPLVGVFGNNDLERESLEAACDELDFRFRDPPLELVWHARRIVVAHDPLELEPGALDGADVLLHGHDHRHANECKGGRLVFNPGECAGHLKGHNAVGILDLARLEAGIVTF
jgi:putative phosphoesterase